MRRSMFKAFAAVAVVTATLGAATPAFAAKPPPPPPPPACAGFMGNFSTAASACQGFFDKNLLNDANAGAQESAVEALLGADIVDFDFNDYKKEDSTLNFGEQLFGDVIIGIHFGAANGDPIHVGGNGATGFFLFHFDKPVDFITTSIGGLSGAVLYTNHTPPPPSVPEPATWAMMLLGFGATGFAMRRRRAAMNTLPQIA